VDKASSLKSKPENAPGYTGTAKALHWTIVALLIVQFVLSWTMP
jgi:cytochrome b561